MRSARTDCDFAMRPADETHAARSDVKPGGLLCCACCACAECDGQARLIEAHASERGAEEEEEARPFWRRPLARQHPQLRRSQSAAESQQDGERHEKKNVGYKCTRYNIQYFKYIGPI